MSADSAVTYTSVHFEARSWSIPSEDPYEEAAQQLFEQAPRSPGYVPENHIPVYIPEPEHPEELVPAEDEAPIPLLPPSFLADAPPRKRLLLTHSIPGVRLERVFCCCCVLARHKEPGPTIETRLLDTERRMMTALELVNRRVTYQTAEANSSKQLPSHYQVSSRYLHSARYALTWWKCPQMLIPLLLKQAAHSHALGTSTEENDLLIILPENVPKEIDKVEKYIGGIARYETWQCKGSKSIDYARSYEFTTELMEDKTHAYAEASAERKKRR
ncbi:hypothetical protein Tco_1183015 [Tanacetum coccineum]